MNQDKLDELLAEVREDEEYEAVDRFLNEQGTSTFYTLEEYED